MDLHRRVHWICKRHGLQPSPGQALHMGTASFPTRSRNMNATAHSIDCIIIISFLWSWNPSTNPSSAAIFSNHEKRELGLTWCPATVLIIADVFLCEYKSFAVFPRGVLESDGNSAPNPLCSVQPGLGVSCSLMVHTAYVA